MWQRVSLRPFNGDVMQTNDSPIRLMIIDDQLIARQGLKALLGDADNILIVGEAGSGAEGIALCQTHQPDVIIMEVLLRNEDGISVLKRLGKVCPQAAIIVMTYEVSVALVQAALALGVLSYVLKD